MQTIQPSGFLRGALVADAAVSGVVAALQLGFAGRLADLLHVPSTLLLGTGAFLVAYVVMLLLLARSARVWPALLWLVILGNVAWAVGCIGLVFTVQVNPSALGMAFLGVQAVTVLIFAVLEYMGLSQSSGGAEAAVVRA